MESEEFLNICKGKVAEYSTENGTEVTPGEIFVVWYCKTLQNHKALLSTPQPDGMYFELTYNGDKTELYFDAYKKQENICFNI